MNRSDLSSAELVEGQRAGIGSKPLGNLVLSRNVKVQSKEELDGKGKETN
jgi:hypothetical protein